MKFLAALVALGAASLAGAQSISDIPQCALPCFIQYVPTTGCQLTDFACLCTQANIDKISSDVTSCVEKDCDTVDTDLQTLTAVNGICKMNGGAQIPTPTSLPPGTGTGNATGAGTSSMSTTVKPGSIASYFTAAAGPAVPTGGVGAMLGAAGLIAAGLAL